MLSPPLLQVMLGRWMPLAEQVRVILPPITTSRLARGVVTVGGTERREKESERKRKRGSYSSNTVSSRECNLVCISLPSTVSSSVIVSMETTPLSATHVYVPLSDRDTLEMHRREEEVLVLELPSVMDTRPLVFSVDPSTTQEMLGAGTPNALHRSSAPSPIITSGPSVKVSSVICEGSLKGKRIKHHYDMLMHFSF